jgi:hypothetical protein
MAIQEKKHKVSIGCCLEKIKIIIMTMIMIIIIQQKNVLDWIQEEVVKSGKRKRYLGNPVPNLKKISRSLSQIMK